ncbi:unnamed protein product [Acanthoscelides obtectus]|uniref:Uncharacterized protein n=1 Tax=Acanthoscelides obtectus TaxID=200917 RepID=A0A9P0PTK4_ACAOB|nr:unnamed protein product [Acanthoscelides obtectus]CAK1640865.1 hypothetical protein AOBTE_LOCUS11981 [Acanthoscelides obtectus]
MSPTKRHARCAFHTLSKFGLQYVTMTKFLLCHQPCELSPVAVSNGCLCAY